MTKKYSPPGGWAAQRQRQILWFLAMFLFFGVMGGWLHHQFAEIWRIDRDTQRLRQRAQELDDEHDRARQVRDDFLRNLAQQQQEQQRREALERHLNLNALRIAQRNAQRHNEQAAAGEWRDWEARMREQGRQFREFQIAFGDQFLVAEEAMAMRPRRYVPERVGGVERRHLDDRNRGRHIARRRIRRGNAPGPGMRGLGLGWLDRPDDGQGEAP